MGDPAEAVPLPGAAPVLGYLADHLHTVAVISGRPLTYLRHHLAAASPSLVLAGLYGLESTVTGRGSTSLGAEAAALWRSRVKSAVADAVASLPRGARLEDKGLALALHFRGAPQLADDVARLASTLASRHGLAERPAKLAVELVPPVHVDKGTTTASLTEGCRVACYVGDDLGDLDAFRALDASAAVSDLVAVKVAVAGDETPDELLTEADLVLDGPPAALAFLAELAGRLGFEGVP